MLSSAFGEWTNERTNVRVYTVQCATEKNEPMVEYHFVETMAATNKKCGFNELLQWNDLSVCNLEYSIYNRSTNQNSMKTYSFIQEFVAKLCICKILYFSILNTVSTAIIPYNQRDMNNDDVNCVSIAITTKFCINSFNYKRCAAFACISKWIRSFHYCPFNWISNKQYDAILVWICMCSGCINSGCLSSMYS